MKKFIAFLLIYLLVGVMVTRYRMRVERWSSGGPGIIIVVMIYPIIYPYGEAVRFVGAIEERAFRKEQADRHVALLCPPAFTPLFREAVLERRRALPAAPYDSLIQGLRKKTLDPADPRAGYVLHQVALAAEALGDAGRARADAAAFVAENNASALRIAAAILGGAYSAAPQDAALAGEALDLYERVYAESTPAETPFASYALGTVCEARGMRDAALDRYRAAIRSGWLDLGMQALVRALKMVGSDEERLEIVDLFAASPGDPKEQAEACIERRLAETGWGDHADLMWFHRRYEAAQNLGWPLFPLRLPAADQAGRFDAFFATDLANDNLVGRNYGWWEELIMAAEPTFDTFPAKLGMVERLLDAVLGFKEERIDIKCLLNQRTREVYYRLYDETGDRRWLDCALPSQLKLRPALKKFEDYIRGELAFMQGEYRRHFDLTERRYLEHGDYPSRPGNLSFIGKKMEKLEIRVDGESRNYAYALEQYQGDLFDALYDKGVPYSDPPENKLRLYEAGELPPPFHDFSDADVYEVSQ